MKLKKCDSEFSRYIRLRDSADRFCTCPLCGLRQRWQDSTCGHYIKRRHTATAWYEDNAMAICLICNEQMENDTTLLNIYAGVICDRIGIERWGILMMLKLKDSRPMQYEIDNLAKYYKQKADELLKQKR